MRQFYHIHVSQVICCPKLRVMKEANGTPPFIRIGTDLINLEYVTSVEVSASGRVTVRVGATNGQGNPMAHEFDDSNQCKKVMEFFKQYVIGELDL